MTPDPPTQAERPARVAIPEALADDVAARPEAYRPVVLRGAAVLARVRGGGWIEGTMSRLDGDRAHVYRPEVAAIPDAPMGSAVETCDAWLAVGSVVGDRVLVLDGSTAAIGCVCRVVRPDDLGPVYCVDDSRNVGVDAARWALLPPPAADEAAPTPTDAPGTSEPAATVSPNPLQNAIDGSGRPLCGSTFALVMRAGDGEHRGETACTFPAGHPPIVDPDGSTWGHGVMDGWERWTDHPSGGTSFDLGRAAPPRYWRVGLSWGRTIIESGTGTPDEQGRRPDDRLVGVVETRADAESIVYAVNLARREEVPTQAAYDAACRALEKHRAEAGRLRTALIDLHNAVEVEPDTPGDLWPAVLRARRALAPAREETT